MEKRVTRSGKVIISEVFVTKEILGYKHEVLVDKKWFNCGLFNSEPKQKHYDKANEWADNVINLHLKNTKI